MTRFMDMSGHRAIMLRSRLLIDGARALMTHALKNSDAARRESVEHRELIQRLRVLIRRG